MFGDHGLGSLLEEGTYEKSPKCLGGNLGDFGEFCKGFSLSEAITSDSFGLMPRQRLRTVQRELYEQLDQIEFLATQRQPEKSEA